MRLIWNPPGVDAVVAAMIHQDTGAEVVFERHQTAGIFTAEGRLAAGVVFSNYDPTSGVIEMSAAALDKRWLLRSIVRELFAYAFNVARMVVVRTRERNAVMRRVMNRLGASEYSIPELFRPGEALLVYTLTPDQFAASDFCNGKPRRRHFRQEQTA